MNSRSDYKAQITFKTSILMWTDVDQELQYFCAKLMETSHSLNIYIISVALEEKATFTEHWASSQSSKMFYNMWQTTSLPLPPSLMPRLAHEAVLLRRSPLLNAEKPLFMWSVTFSQYELN